MQTFDSGATRNEDSGKLDYEGFFSPEVMECFAKYMHQHRKQADGKMRESDNWQKGIPLFKYMKSELRHVMDLWKLHRGIIPKNPDTGEGVTIEEACCGIMFNTMGYLLETLKAKKHNWSTTATNQQPFPIIPIYPLSGGSGSTFTGKSS